MLRREFPERETGRIRSGLQNGRSLRRRGVPGNECRCGAEHRDRKIQVMGEAKMRIKRVRVAVGLALATIASVAPASFAQYVRTDLASNIPGATPSTDQQHLINSWG